MSNFKSSGITKSSSSIYRLLLSLFYLLIFIFVMSAIKKSSTFFPLSLCKYWSVKEIFIFSRKSKDRENINAKKTRIKASTNTLMMEIHTLAITNLINVKISPMSKLTASVTNAFFLLAISVFEILYSVAIFPMLTNTISLWQRRGKGS